MRTLKIRTLPDASLLRELLEYRPDTGDLIWLPRRPDHFADGTVSRENNCASWNAKNAHKPALRCVHNGRHFSGGVFGKLHLAHRVAWAIHYGVSEFGLIDHEDGNGFNNRINNLRLANAQMNAQNARRRKDCSSGITGVRLHTDKRWGEPRWAARIQVGGRRLFLGSFESMQDAIDARRAAEARYDFGPAHGKPRDE